MKHLRLFLVAIAAVFGLGASAQTWTPPTITGDDPVSGTTYKLFNVEAGKYLAEGQAWFGWSTTAILADNASQFTFAGNESSFTLTTIRSGNNKFFTSGNGIEGDAMHVDGGNYTNYGLTKLPSGYYRIHDAGGNADSPCWGYNSSFHAKGVVAHADATAEGWMCDWIFVGPTSSAKYSAQLNLYNTHLKATEEGVSTDEAAVVYNNPDATVDELNAATAALNQARFENKLAIASDDNPQDITEFVLKNADFSAGNIDGWETNYVAGQQAQNIGYQGAGYSNGTIVISQFIEAWKPGATLGNGYLRQTVQGLPEGKYVLEADGISAWQNDDSREITGAYLFINAAGVDYKTAMSTKNGKPEHFTAQFLSPGDVDVTFGLKTESATCNWLCADNFQVKFFGIDLNPYKTLLAQAVEEAQAVEGIPTAAYEALAAVVAENNKEWSSSKEYTDAIAAIQAATAEAKALQAPYSRYQTIKNAVLAINSEINTTEPDATASAATNIAGIEEAVLAVRNALSVYLANANIEDQEISLTAALIDNANVGNSGNTEYWTVSDNPSWDFNLAEFWQQSGASIKQNIPVTLPAGYYILDAIAYTRDNMTSVLNANDNTMNIAGVSSNTVNLRSEGDNWIAQGNGYNELFFQLAEPTTLEIGLTADNATGDHWTCFRSFGLKYLGTNPVSLFVSDYEKALAAANTANNDEANANVTGSEKTAIENAIADTPEETIESYIEKTEALKATTQAFIAAAPAYDAYAAEKAIAEMIGVTPGEEPANAAAATAGVNALKVAEFDFVKENYKFDYEPVIGTFGEWTGTATVGGQPGTPHYLSNEHWSGQTHAYYEQDENGWGNANGWTIKYEKTAKLPAGDYMLKVAARSSAGTTSLVSCTATENTVSLPTAGNATKGIALDGTASFEGDNFANGGNGFGWEWRFLPFTLTEETEVTMTFYAEATTQYQWMSIADGTLLSKQEIQNIVEIAGTDEAAPEAQVATSVITDRKLLAGLNTVIFPFETTDAELSATTVLAYTGTTVEADGLTFNFQKVAPVDGVVTLQANTPYAVFVAADQTENLTFGTKNINPGGGWYNECVTDDPNDQFDFRGTYSEWKKGESAIGDKDYIAGKERFVKASGGNRLQAYRAYLQFVGTEEPANVAFNFGGFVVDGIEAVELLNNLSGNIYNLNGQKLQKAQKGINIVNGKKVLVK